jgi:hypothetical protein
MANRPEQRSGELYRNGGNRPRPGPDLGQPEAKLFRSIVASKPADWFSPATAVLLTRFVKTSVYAEKVQDELENLPIGSPEAAVLVRQLAALNTNLCTLASKMRLSQQAASSPRSIGRNNEAASLIGSPLIGGSARGLRQ